METKDKAISSKLISKLIITFFLLIVLMGISYILFAVYFTDKYVEESSQRLNASMAKELIEEKFLQASPFLEDGSVNKELFGDLMHDMMAVNRSIEVYLLDDAGEVLYSVVLDHDNPNEPATKIDLEPVRSFIETEGSQYILGDDPRNVGEKKIFSAAPYNVVGREGYVYIVLAGKAWEDVNSALFTSYFLKLGTGATVLTMIFALIIGSLSIWFLTRNLRTIIQTVKRFREGDMSIRISDPQKSDLSVLAQTFNDMADTIVDNMEEIKSIDNLRRELIANVSHDLRTPLSVLKGYAETLQIKKETLTEEERESYLEIIQNSAEKLSRLVAQLFEYSKLEAKQVKPVKEPFSITDLVLDLIAHYQLIADKKSIEINLDADASLPLVFADISLVERAIQNLMDNAIKFTPDGGNIKLSLKSGHKNVKVMITDSGPGIDVEEQAFIFERYRRADRVKQSEGSGLGLAIVKKIMELHNTTIEVTSQPQMGSSFLFYLPSYTA